MIRLLPIEEFSDVVRSRITHHVDSPISIASTLVFNERSPRRHGGLADGSIGV
jgi:hypothetical protein